MPSLARQLFPLLQLTRMALVFTAIADSQAELLLRWRMPYGAGGAGAGWPADWGWQALAIGLVSVGLYGFGMSLNDIIDRRRDRQIAAHRPLPSGRVGIVTAHVICGLLAATALLGAGLYAYQQPHAATGRLSCLLTVGTGLLIAFYDFAGKYLVAPGLLTLGMIRLFHSVIPSPELPLLWHPLLLLNHVAILSTVCYVWEEKRPALTRGHWWGVLGGLGFLDAVAIGLVTWKRYPFRGTFAEATWVQPGLILPGVAVLLFLVLAVRVRRAAPSSREAGQRLMLYGLLWLIVYDAAFVAGYVSWVAGGTLLALLPVAYLSVQLMRWWGKLLIASQRPQYQRAGVKR